MKRTLLRVVPALTAVTLIACATVPITGRSQLLLLPEGAETQMGLDAYRQILAKSRVSTDPALNEQVTRVGRRIAEATGRTDYQWEFKVIEDKQANAFCRQQESEADHLGLIFMAKAGYHPSAARDLWVRMDEAARGKGAPPEFLSTHPAPATRIRQIEAWIPEALRYYRPR